MPVKHIDNDGQFTAAMGAAGAKPVIVDFYADWCGPCKMIAPVFDSLSNKYMTCDFLKVNVDKCQGTTEANNVSAMPTFVVFVNNTKVDSVKGANQEALETMIRKWADTQPSSDVPGQSDLTSLIDRKQMEVMNEDTATPLASFLDGRTSLRSDCDEQLILSLPFNQPVKVHSIAIKGVEDRSPKEVRIWINLPKAPDFDNAEELNAVQEVEFTDKATSPDGEIVNLRYVKFQNVQSIQFFIKNNVGGGEVTELESLKIYGTPLSAMNMDNFKRTSGKAGEVDH